MPDWYKQSTKEYLSGEFRNNFNNDSDLFIDCNGMLHILKQVIGRNLDLKKAVLYRGQYLDTVTMDKDYFLTIMKCKDWNKLKTIMVKLQEISIIKFYETPEGLLAIEIPSMLEDLDQYTSRRLKKLIDTGKVSVEDINRINSSFNPIDLDNKALEGELMAMSLDTNDSDTTDKSSVVVDDTCDDLPQARVEQESIGGNGFDENSVNTLEDSKKHKVYSNIHGYLNQTGTEWCRYKFPRGHKEHKNYELVTDTPTKKKNKNFMAG
tara:strand:+ start:63 stop:857 length:795 start_codon:yes stop_codon:yes gene_type:complete